MFVGYERDARTSEVEVRSRKSEVRRPKTEDRSASKNLNASASVPLVTTTNFSVGFFLLMTYIW
ncbi:MAG: hypothetical protein PHW92_12570 [Lutibacter sp.]|nr:hypothetical protein [Lutibacter sp.]